jgi:hemerythrin-like domain-containing protein
MNTRVQSLRDEHRVLQEQADELCEAARAVAMLDVDGRRAIQEQLVDFLRDRVAPHTRLDERVLYPEVTARLGDPLATASMNYDHLAIRQWIDDIAEADASNVSQLQQLLYGLHALISVHIWKEDELYLAALESPSWPGPSG